MTSFPDITNADIRNLIAYINSASAEQAEKDRISLLNWSLESTSIQFEEIKPCYYDTSYSFVKDSFPFYDTIIPPLVLDDTANLNDANISDYVPDEEMLEYYRNLNLQRYDFNITSNGWYNVDALLKEDDLTNISEVKLTAEIRSAEKVYINVVLFVPSKKILQYSTGKKDQQYFFKFNNQGTIPLPLNEKAILFAFGTSGEKLVYGITEFEINADQTIPLQIGETTKEEFQYLLQSKKINDINLELIEKKRTVLPVYCDTALKSSIIPVK
jgi:hypothetical protein